MLWKIATLFLIAMAALALIGRLRLPLRGRPRDRIHPPTVCGRCGRFIVAKGPCDCEDRR